jgi:transposase-like protein
MNLESFYSLSIEDRGRFLIDNGITPKVKEESVFTIPSQFKKDKYTIAETPDGFECSCADYKFRQRECKHIHALRYWIDYRQYLTKEGIYKGTENALPNCIHCNSLKVVKFGMRKKKQRLKCEACGKTFVANPEFRGLSTEPKAIVLYLDLYFKGLSLRKIKSTLKQFYEVKVTHETIRRWKNRFMKQINDYVEAYKPEIKGSWHMDETKVKSKREWLWVWNTIDAETKFLMASTVSVGKTMQETRQHIKECRENNGGVKPDFVTTDGLGVYPRALRKEMQIRKTRLNRTGRTQHIISQGFYHNQLAERHHSTMKERTKIMRGLADYKSVERHAKDYRTFFNFVRENQAIQGNTPNEKIGLMELGENKWLSLIKKAGQVS